MRKLRGKTNLFESWFPYWMWECFINGMWEKRKNEMNIVQKCAALLSNSVECENAMRSCLVQYPISARQHLTKQHGKNPWIGAAACLYSHGATEEETRIAWNFYMSKEDQDEANRIADMVIEEWEINNA